MRCAIYGCSANNKKQKLTGQISFHSFPKEPKLCKQWVISCHRSDKINTETARICSKHFIEGDFVPPAPIYAEYGIVLPAKRLKKVAVPSLLLPLQKKEQDTTTARKLRAKKNRSLVTSDPLTIETSELIIKQEEPTEDSFVFVDCSNRIQVTMVDSSTQVGEDKIDCSSQTDEVTPTYSQLQEEIVKLKAQCWKQKQIIDAMGIISASIQVKKTDRLRQGPK